MRTTISVRGLVTTQYRLSDNATHILSVKNANDFLMKLTMAKCSFYQMNFHHIPIHNFDLDHIFRCDANENKLSDSNTRWRKDDWKIN